MIMHAGVDEELSLNKRKTGKYLPGCGIIRNFAAFRGMRGLTESLIFFVGGKKNVFPDKLQS